jgi:guanyl-specific ribonuclease Sa
MKKILILIAFGAIVAGCSKQAGNQEYDSTGSSTTNTSSSSQYSAPPPAPNTSAARGAPAPASDTPKHADTSSHY